MRLITRKTLRLCFLFLSDGLSVFIIFTKATTQRSLRYGLDETTSQRVVKHGIVEYPQKAYGYLKCENVSKNSKEHRARVEKHQSG